MDAACSARMEELEDLFGGRVLAWVGGLAVLVGFAFLFAVAISHGWIGEGARIGLAGLTASALVGAGTWLRERRARSDAALAAVAAGIAGQFLTVTVAAQVYEIMPSSLGVVLALAVGGLATALALRWSSQGIAALGILGALAAPQLAGAPLDSGTVVLLFIALAAAAGVLLWQRWDWLALAAFAIATPQWLISLFRDGSSTPSALLTVAAFGVLGVVVAVGHDVRIASERVRPAPAFLLALNALVMALAGWSVLMDLDRPFAANAWLAGLAFAHLGVGLAGPRLARVSEDLGRLALVLAMLLADVAFSVIAHGVALPLGWTAVSVAFAALLRRTAPRTRDETLAATGLGGHLALALVLALTAGDPLETVAGGGALSTACLMALATLAAGCLISARLLEDGHPFEWRLLLDGLGLTVLALLTAGLLDGQMLVLAWAGEAMTLSAIAARRTDRVAGGGALAFLALAGAHALTVEARLSALVRGFAHPYAAVAAVGSVAVAVLLASVRLAFVEARLAGILRVTAGTLVLYLASGLVVTAFDGSGTIGSTLLLSAHQQGQMALSVFWAATGVGALVVGLRRDLVAVRLAALALLGVTVVKVFLFDLATLTSIYRVVSFIALGLLLLIGAFVWERLRQHPDVPA